MRVTTQGAPRPLIGHFIMSPSRVLGAIVGLCIAEMGHRMTYSGPHVLPSLWGLMCVMQAGGRGSQPYDGRGGILCSHICMTHAHGRRVAQVPADGLGVRDAGGGREQAARQATAAAGGRGGGKVPGAARLDGQGGAGNG